MRFSDAVPQSTLAVPAKHPQSLDPCPGLKPELLPPNLVDLTVRKGTAGPLETPHMLKLQTSPAPSSPPPPPPLPVS